MFSGGALGIGVTLASGSGVSGGVVLGSGGKTVTPWAATVRAMAVGIYSVGSGVGSSGPESAVQALEQVRISKKKRWRRDFISSSVRVGQSHVLL